MNKLEFPIPKDKLCIIWLKLAQWFWRRSFFKFVNVFSQFRNYPLEKGGTLHLNKLEFPFTQEYLVPSFVEIGPVVLEKNVF